MSVRKIGIGVGVGIWVAVYAMLQTLVAGAFGVEAELWPVLMAPGVVGLLGHGKEGTQKFYKMFLTGILAGCAFILAEHLLAPVLGTAGVLGPLAVIVAIIVILGFVLPGWFGGATFIAFCCSTILTTDILALTLVRIIVLLVGATVFLFVEHAIIKAFSRPAKKVPEPGVEG